MKQVLTGSFLLFAVASGLAFAALCGDPLRSIDLLHILFLGFAGAVIAVQLIPSGLMLRRILSGLLYRPERNP